MLKKYNIPGDTDPITNGCGSGVVGRFPEEISLWKQYISISISFIIIIINLIIIKYQTTIWFNLILRVHTFESFDRLIYCAQKSNGKLGSVVLLEFIDSMKQLLDPKVCFKVSNAASALK